jgi:hypothetical protein
MSPSEIKNSYIALRQNARSPKDIRDWFKTHARDVTTLPAIYEKHVRVTVSRGSELYNASDAKGGPYAVFEIEMAVKLTDKQANEMAWMHDIITFDGDTPGDPCMPWAARYGVEIPAMMSSMSAALLIARWFDTGEYDGDSTDMIEDSQIAAVLTKHYPGLTVDILKMMHENGMLPEDPKAFTAWATQMSTQGVPTMELPSAGM